MIRVVCVLQDATNVVILGNFGVARGPEMIAIHVRAGSSKGRVCTSLAGADLCPQKANRFIDKRMPNKFIVLSLRKRTYHIYIISC